jgi:predicted permease
MTTLRVLLSRLRSLVRSRALDRDVREQIESHLEEATDEYVRQGLSPIEARRAAMRDFGGVVRAEEACRDARGVALRDLSKDLRYGARTLGRNPAFSAVAVLSLAVGIGANTAIFSIVNAVLLRPRPVREPDRLVELYVGERRSPYETTSYPSYLDFRERNGVFSGLAAYGIEQFRLAAEDQVEQIWGEVVSGNYFEVLGVQAHTGRTLIAHDSASVGDNPVAVIGHGLWQRRFNADPNAIGRTMTINRQALTVVGVAPPEYTGMIRGLSIDVWVPATAFPLLDPIDGRARLESRGSRWLALVGRLRPGVTLDQARARFDLLSLEMQANHPDEWRSKWPSETGGLRELFVTVVAERDTRIPPDMHAAAYALVALVAAIVNVVLIMACMNLASMLLVRAVVRRKEIAVRLAMGASRFRVVRQLMMESLLLSVVAGAAGVVFTVWLLDTLVASMPAFPEGVRVALDLRPDWRVFAYSVGFSTLTGVLFGLAPALQASRTDVSGVLKDDAGTFASGYRQSRVRAALVVAQVAFSLLLLIGAGLVLRSLGKIQPTRLGFASDNVLTVFLNLDEGQYDRLRSQDFYRQTAERVTSLPGVQTVSLIDGIPGGFMTRSRRSTEIEGYHPAPGESLEIDASIVSPRYFTNMKVPIVQGRDFDERDREGAPCVAIVNEAFSARYFAGAISPLGKHLVKYSSDGSKLVKHPCAIVGVVRDDRLQSLLEKPRPVYTVPLLQSYRQRMTMLVHTAGDPASLTGPVRRAIQAIDPDVPVSDVQPVRELFSAMAYPFRLLGVAMAACGLMALLLATIGVYGLVSYSVAQRTREVGIRIALGALKKEILAMVVRQAMALVAWGLAIGLLLSLALTRVLTSAIFETELLFGVTATDSLTFAGVTILLSLVALAACSIPALRATRVDPIEALRYG